MPQRDPMLGKRSVGGDWRALSRQSSCVARLPWPFRLGNNHVDISRTVKKFPAGARSCMDFKAQFSPNDLITQRIKDSTGNLIGTRSAKG